MVLDSGAGADIQSHPIKTQSSTESVSDDFFETYRCSLRESTNRYIQSLLISNDIAVKYHQNEIESLRKLMSNILWFMWIFGGISMIVTGFFAAFENRTGAISTSAFGGIIEVVSGWVVKLLNASLQSKDEFFDKNFEMQNLDKILGLIMTIENKDNKFTLINKIVDNYIYNTTNPKDKS